MNKKGLPQQELLNQQQTSSCHATGFLLYREENIGRLVTARYIRAKDGIKEIAGELISYADNTAVIRDEDGKEYSVNKTETAYIRLQDDYDYSKGEGQ